MRKKHPEHVNLERWLVSYADFITLLFAFFVVMYAISQADLAKLKQVSASIKAAFSSGGGGPSGTVGLKGTASGSTVEPSAGKTSTASPPESDLVDMKEKFEESVSLELGVSDISDKVQMQYDSRGLVVRLAAKDFFEPGKAEVRSDLRPVLDRIGRVLATTQRLVRIEGHTDPSEAALINPGYLSGWELSAARAAWVVKYWIGRFKLDPKHLGIAGFSHYRPLSLRQDPWSQAKNRRVEIIILNNQYE